MLSPVYTGDPFAYDITAALAPADQRHALENRAWAREREAEQNTCIRLPVYERSTTTGTLSAPAPTAQQLHAHVEKFGPECAAEAAKAYGIDMRVKKPDPKKPKRQRRTTAELLSQARDLKARGMLDAAIADALNVSDARVRKLLRAA